MLVRYAALMTELQYLWPAAKSLTDGFFQGTYTERDNIIIFDRLSIIFCGPDRFRTCADATSTLQMRRSTA